MVEPEKNPGGIPVDREGNAAPAVADVAMTRGQRALWIALIAAQVLIALATVLCHHAWSGDHRERHCGCCSALP
jgi:hypothetical protein